MYDISHAKCLELLLKNGANPNSERNDENLKYPLFYALRESNVEIMNLLIDSKADCTVKNSVK